MVERKLFHIKQVVSEDGGPDLTSSGVYPVGLGLKAVSPPTLGRLDL